MKVSRTKKASVYVRFKMLKSECTTNRRRWMRMGKRTGRGNGDGDEDEEGRRWG